MSLSRRLSAVVAGTAAAMLALSACSDPAASTYEPPYQAEGSLPAETVAQLEDAVIHAMGTTGASGAIVGVWAPWAGSWVAGLGTQSADSSVPVTSDMSFRIADVTRLMTCDLLYILDADGVLSKDAPVSQYVSGVPNLSDVSLLDLCNGTAGIGTFEGTVGSMVLRNPERQWGPLELAAYGVGKARTEIKTKYRNSDAAYMLLGLALERATGKSASTLYSEYLAAPLELEGTVLPSPAAALPEGNALFGHYLPREDGDFVCTEPVDISRMSSSIGYTDSGAVSTIDDLGRYMRAMATQVLAGGENSTRWAEPLPLSDDAASWRQATGGAHLVGPLIGQYGTIPGYATAAFSDPETGFTIAVVMNNSSAGGAPIAYLAWELAAIASKVPAASGETEPEFALPFTADTYHKRIADRAICSPPAED